MTMTTFTLNGRTVSVDGDPSRPLVDVLRSELDLSSVRVSCGVGLCGTCTVLLDGRAVSGCLLIVGMVEGREVQTTEGVSASDSREAFIDACAFQCSFCIPAMVLTADSVRNAHPGVTAEELTEQLAGNLCRCGSYPQIRAALRSLCGPTTSERPS